MRSSATGQTTVLACLLVAALAESGCQRAAAPSLPTIPTKSGIDMVAIPAGSFLMGSRQGREDEGPVHQVWIDAFLMDTHEVTQAVYEKLGQVEAFPNPS